MQRSIIVSIFIILQLNFFFTFYHECELLGPKEGSSFLVPKLEDFWKFVERFRRLDPRPTMILIFWSHGPTCYRDLLERKGGKGSQGRQHKQIRRNRPGPPSNVTSSSIVERMFLVVYTSNKPHVSATQSDATRDDLSSLSLSLSKQRESRLSTSIHYSREMARFQKTTKNFVLINLSYSRGLREILLFYVYIYMWFL